MGSAVVLGGLSAKAATVFAPVVLFPIAVGCLLAGMIVLWLRILGVAHRSTLIVGATIAAMVLAGAQHWFSYIDAQRHTKALEHKLATAAAAFPDLAGRLVIDRGASFSEFVERSAARGVTLAGRYFGAGGVYALWMLDALVPCVVVALLVSRAQQQPFCDRCGTWFRTIRRGTLGPATAADLANAAGIRPALAQPAHYRLASCASGCGPATLEVSWFVRGVSPRTAWLDAGGRQRIMAILDAASTTEIAAQQN